MNITHIGKYKKTEQQLYDGASNTWIFTKYKKLNMTEHKTDMNITKYKKLNMTEHKTDMNITKIDKYKNLNSYSMTEHKTDMNITKDNTDHDRAQNRHKHHWKTEQRFYHETQNWHEHDWKSEQNFYDRTLNRTQLHFGESNNKHTRMFVSCFDKIEWFYDRCKGFINKLFACLPLLENFMRIFVSCFDKVEWFFSGSNFLCTIQFNCTRLLHFIILTFLHFLH